MGQFVVFGAGVCEDINEGPRQGDLQCNLYCTDAHLWTITATLRNSKIIRKVHDYLLIPL